MASETRACPACGTALVLEREHQSPAGVVRYYSCPVHDGQYVTRDDGELYDAEVVADGE